MTGISTAGIVGFSERTLAQEEEDTNVTIEVPDQVSDGESVVIESFGSVEILRELHVLRIIRRDEAPPEVADSPVY